MDDLKVTRINNVLHGAELMHDINQDGLGRYIFDLMRKNGEKIFQINALTEEEESYNSVNKKCIRVALGMKKRGINKDDVVLIISQNTMNAFIPVAATLYLNAITATLDPSIALRDIKHLVQLTHPKMVFTVRESLETIQKVLNELGLNVDVIIMETAQNESGESELTLAKFLEPNPEEHEFVPEVIDDAKKTAVLLFSSGTTGMPKQIKISHFGLLYTIAGEMMCGYDFSVALAYTSFYWISAYLITLFSLITGGRKVIPGTFEPNNALEYFVKYKVTFTLLATSYMHQLTSKKNTQSYNNIYPKYIVYGGSGMGPDSVKKIYSYFPNSKSSFVYGSSELSGFITDNIRNYEFIKTKPSSVGIVNPGVKLKIADLDTEESLPPNREGEIRILTKGLFNGYGNENSSDTLDKDGFLKSGDIGYYDEDNCLYVSDRIKEMFKYRDWHIVPNSLENVIYQYPAVQEAIVVGIPHDTDGHRPMAVVVLHENSEKINELDLEKFVNDRVLDREKLRAGLRIVKTLPKTPTGKIMRKYIRDLIIDGKLNELQ